MINKSAGSIAEAHLNILHELLEENSNDVDVLTWLGHRYSEVDILEINFLFDLFTKSILLLCIYIYTAYTMYIYYDIKNQYYILTVVVVVVVVVVVLIIEMRLRKSEKLLCSGKIFKI